MSEQRALPHAIRRPAIRHGTRCHRATGRTARDPAPAIPHTTTIFPPCPATGHSRRAGPYGTRSGDGSFPPRRAIPHAIRRWAIPAAPGRTAHDPATGYPARDDPLVSGYARTMPGRCPDDARTMPDDVSRPGLSGDCCTGCERPNGSP